MTKVNRRTLVAGAAAAGIAATALGGAKQASAARQGGKTELTMLHIWGTAPGGTPAAKPAPMTQVVDAFNAQSETVVINQSTPGGYYETLQKTQADMAAGNAPDIVSTPWAFLNYAVEGLGVNDIETVAGDQFAELKGLMKDSAWDLVNRDDKHYGMPWGLSTPILYYNADIFKAAGVDPKVVFSTWEAFAEAAPKLQVDGGPVISLQFNKDWPAQTIIQSNGGRVLNDDGSFGIASPEAIEAMQTIADLDKGGFYDRGLKPELRPSFIAGTTAVFQGSVASLNGLRNECTFTLGTSTWPKFGEKPIVASTGGSFLGVYSFDESKYAAITEFFQFAAGEVGYPIWNQTGYINMSSLELDRLEGQEPAYAQFDQGLILETNWPSSRGVEAGSTWDGYCERIWANDIPVEEGVNAALAELKSITGQ
ncbi:MAG: extracellular solute-binding protein [Thermomicrobiales bacterium]